MNEVPATGLKDEFREIEQRMSQALTEIQIERNRLEQFEQQHEQVMEERTRLQENGQEVLGLLEALTGANGSKLASEIDSPVSIDG